MHTSQGYSKTLAREALSHVRVEALRLAHPEALR